MIHLRREQSPFEEFSVGVAAKQSQKRHDLVSAGSAIQSGVKRAFDLVFATLMIVVFAPLMIFIGLLIWRRDGAPVLFAHKRVGKGGRIFRCLKFRTMMRNSQDVLEELLATDEMARLEWRLTYKLENDPRIIPDIGTLLRKSSLDELPQLFNVIRGDMSLVGPRPVVADELHKYGAYRNHYTAVKPGLTGLWQVGGRSNASYETRIEMDVWYVENACLRTDFFILLQTVTLFVTGCLSGAK